VLRGLGREDLFTIVHEQVLTDTTRWADLVLPAVTFLEQHEVKRAYGSYVVGGVRPVVAPQGEARPNEAVFAGLAQRLGFTDEAFTWDTETLVRRIAGALSGIQGQADTYLDGGIQTTTFEGGTPIQFGTVLPRTLDGKGHLAPALLGKDAYRYDPIASPGFPLALLSPASPKMTSSTLGEFNYPELRLSLNPADAAARSIAQGDPVRVWNELGEVHCTAELSDHVRPGVAVLPKGAWMKASRNGRTATALAPAHLEPTAGGACYNDARVEVARLEPV
jgi:anaerobic selenocysteine-containing dehydrogenase